MENIKERGERAAGEVVATQDRDLNLNTFDFVNENGTVPVERRGIAPENSSLMAGYGNENIPLGERTKEFVYDLPDRILMTALALSATAGAVVGFAGIGKALLFLGFTSKYAALTAIFAGGVIGAIGGAFAALFVAGFIGLIGIGLYKGFKKLKNLF